MAARSSQVNGFLAERARCEEPSTTSTWGADSRAFWSRAAWPVWKGWKRPIRTAVSNGNAPFTGASFSDMVRGGDGHPALDALALGAHQAVPLEDGLQDVVEEGIGGQAVGVPLARGQLRRGLLV